MKEATGELSTTVIAVVAIAAVAAIFTIILLPTLKNNIIRRTYCSSAYSCSTCSEGSMTCKYIDKDGQEQKGLTCDCSSTNN